ncbi:MAG: NAD-dependent epimerase/dehydratase family protein [Kibdelosporangium sp.]
MKVLVTGGAGFIGANLCRELLLRGHDVVVLDDLSTGLRSNLDGVGVQLREGSVLHAGELAAACRGVDSIVHLAAVPSVTRSLENPRRSHDAIATGTLAVLDAAREIGAHILVASSSSVYGSNPVLPRSEDAVCMPSSPYAASKLAAESYTMAYRSSFGLESLAFRFFNVFGPLQLANHAYAAVVPKFVHAALHGEPVIVHGDGEQSRDFTFVDSVVEVLADGVSRRITSDTPVNLAFGTRTTVNELVALLARVLDRPIEITFAPPRTGDVRDSQATGVSVRRLFPLVEPVSLEAGVRRTIAWMRRSARPVPAGQRS